jgi:hypothetical protein
MKDGSKNLIGKLFTATALMLFALQIAFAGDFVETEHTAAQAHIEYTVNSTLKLSGETKESSGGFYNVLSQILIKRGWKKESLCDARDVVVSRIVREYGAIFVVNEKVKAPPVCMFTGAEEVDKFQKTAGFAAAMINGSRIELQQAAMESLLKAREEALSKGLNITPRDGIEAGRRSFADTIRLWKSRFEPALEHWRGQSRLTDEEIEKLRSLAIKEQVQAVLELEKQGIYFNKFFNNSILYSVAAPGASQHLSMLAFDVVEYDNPEVREILANHGWFQTVRNDSPHFTFLGHRKEDLSKLGLKEVQTGSGKFWVPNV